MQGGSAPSAAKQQQQARMAVAAGRPGARTVLECLEGVSDAEAALLGVRRTLDKLLQQEASGLLQASASASLPSTMAPAGPSVGATAAEVFAAAAFVSAGHHASARAAAVEEDAKPEARRKRAASAAIPDVAEEGAASETAAKAAAQGDEEGGASGDGDSNNDEDEGGPQPERVLLDQAVLTAMEEGAKERALQKSISMGGNLDLVARQMSQRAITEKRKSMELGIQDGGFFYQPLCGGRIPFWVMHPECRCKLLWNIVGFTFIIFEAIWIPFYMSFDAQPTGIWFTFIAIIDIYFIVDIMLSFTTAVLDPQRGELVTSPAKIARKYFRLWFWLDIVAGIPWELLPDVPSDLHGASGPLMRALPFMKAARFLRAARLLRLLHGHLVPDRVQMFMERNPILIFAAGVSNVLFLLIGVTHWMACIWYTLGTTVQDEHTWVAKYIPEGSHLFERYFYALYFTLTTMTTVGYGDITPQNYTEVRYLLILLVVASVVFATLMGWLTTLMGNLNEAQQEIEAQKLVLSRYMHWRGIPYGLFWAVRQHMIFRWNNKGYDKFEVELKEQLTPMLRKELCYHIYGGLLKAVPFLAWVRGYEVCLKELADNLTSAFLSQGDYLFRPGQPNEQIILLIAGRVYLSRNQSLFNQEPGDDIWADHEKLKDEMKAKHGRKRQEEQQSSCQRGAAGLTSRIAAISKFCCGQKQSKPGEEGPIQVIPGSQAEKILQIAKQKSEVMTSAAETLGKLDDRERWAASFVQLRWRFKQVLRGGADNKPEPKGLNKMQSKSVEAIAYFGESCLWTPFNEWDNAPKAHVYAARCETRCELVNIPRTVVKDLILRFDPWLIDRFEYFQKEVVEGLKRRAVLDQGVSEDDRGEVGQESDQPAANNTITNSVDAALLTASEAGPSDSSAPGSNTGSRRAQERSFGGAGPLPPSAGGRPEESAAFLAASAGRPGGSRAAGFGAALLGGGGPRGASPRPPLSSPLSQRREASPGLLPPYAAWGAYGAGLTSQSSTSRSEASLLPATLRAFPQRPPLSSPHMKYNGEDTLPDRSPPLPGSKQDTVGTAGPGLAPPFSASAYLRQQSPAPLSGSERWATPLRVPLLGPVSTGARCGSAAAREQASPSPLRTESI